MSIQQRMDYGVKVTHHTINGWRDIGELFSIVGTGNLGPIGGADIEDLGEIKRIVMYIDIVKRS